LGIFCKVQLETVPASLFITSVARGALFTSNQKR